MAPTLLDLGLPRTGTQSLANALELLGYPKVYHMREVDQNPGHRQTWIDLIHAQYGRSMSSSESNPKDLEEAIRELLKDYDACADFPVALFPSELLQAYPKARVIVTIRDEDGWINSMGRTLVYPLSAQKQAEKVNEMRAAYNTYCWNDDFEANGRNYWHEHLALVKKLTQEAGREVLWFDFREGWGPLCKFLGVAVPEGVEFPNADEAPRRPVQVADATSK